MKRIIFATGNKDKLREIREIMEGTGYEIVSMADAGVHTDIIEDGKTFKENALIKAEAVWKLTGGTVMSDDSGIVIDALGGAPGVLSARFMGETTSYDIKNSCILEKLRDVPDEKRTARFVAAVACIFPDGSRECAEAAMEGRIAHAICGTGGFGYDPIFIPVEETARRDGICRTTAEMSEEEKNEISHRGKALRLIREILLQRG